MHKSDVLLEADVQDELDWDSRLDDARVIVKASGGDVTLSGAVDTYYDTTLAAEDAWSVSGVKSVDNQLLVSLVGDSFVDTTVAADCVEALDRDPLVPMGAVSLSVANGWVTLTGQVNHQHERKAAENAVAGVAGVVGVSSEITLAGDPMPSDIVDRINKAFQRNAIIDDSLIEVSATGNTVYLDGSVDTWYAMDRAVDAAWNAPGVTEVANRLVIAL
jgi:osmotically-inducible protein OsmY